LALALALALAAASIERADMRRPDPGSLLAAALLRPLNLLAPGAGLLLALSWGPWWTFPLSLLPYALMVTLSVRDPAFVQRALRASAADDAGEPIDWPATARQLGRGAWAPSLERIATAERNLGVELGHAPDDARAILASTLSQVRSAARLGIELARRLRTLDYALQAYAGMNPAQSRAEAQDKRRRAEAATDDAARRAFLDAANALEESARSAASLLTLRKRTVAQLDNLAATLESVAVRSVRVRVEGGGGPGEIAETLSADMQAVRETLDVLESVDETAPGGTAAR
jgi:hypothetical protein